MDIDTVFKIPSTSVDKRKHLDSASVPSTSLSASLPIASKRSKNSNGPLEIHESTDEDFHARWGIGSTTAKRTPIDNDSSKSSHHSNDNEPSNPVQWQQQRVLDLVEAGEELPSVISLPLLKRILLKFEKALSKNQEQRIKHADSPLKYLDSEADLVEEIKTMTTISSVPELYPAMLDLGAHQSILALVSHENTDISIAAIELIDELTDEDLVVRTSGGGEEGMGMLVQALIESDAFPLLVQNLNRLDESRPDDKQGIFNTLSVIENFVAVDPLLAEKVVSSTNIFPWILARISQKSPFDSIRQYASELLTILLQTSHSNRQRIISLAGIDTLLRVISPYRRKDPADPDETEFFENVFDTICLCLDLRRGKTDFVDAEGIELMLMMIKSGKMSRMRAIKVIDHLLLREGPLADDEASAADSDAVSTVTMASRHFIEVLGLKTVFAAFIHKGARKYKKMYADYSQREEEEHIVSILASLLKSLDSESSRARLLFKLIESDFEKTQKLLGMYQSYTVRVRAVDAQIAARRQRARNDLDGDGGMTSQDDAMADLERLSGGLFTLQLVCLVIAYACDESYEVREFALKGCMDGDGNSRASHADAIDAADLQTILREYAENLGDRDLNTHDQTKNADIQTEKSVVLRLVDSLGADPLDTLPLMSSSVDLTGGADMHSD
ncbi:hypothetical protein BASA60_001252 [Batrachochytrium salamandrivorans]|nr:hypothetical protein BASA60_001252 [Batrachochytrium salamandrivorans]